MKRIIILCMSLELFGMESRPTQLKRTHRVYKIPTIRPLRIEESSSSTETDVTSYYYYDKRTGFNVLDQEKFLLLYFAVLNFIDAAPEYPVEERATKFFKSYNVKGLLRMKSQLDKDGIIPANPFLTLHGVTPEDNAI